MENLGKSNYDTSRYADYDYVLAVARDVADGLVDDGYAWSDADKSWCDCYGDEPNWDAIESEAWANDAITGNGLMGHYPALDDNAKLTAVTAHWNDVLWAADEFATNWNNVMRDYPEFCDFINYCDILLRLCVLPMAVDLVQRDGTDLPPQSYDR